MEGEIFPKIFTLLKDPDEIVQKNAATNIREIAKHTPEVYSAISVLKVCTLSVHITTPFAVKLYPTNICHFANRLKPSNWRVRVRVRVQQQQGAMG